MRDVLDFPMIGIGASTVVIKPLGYFFKKVSVTSDSAYVVIQKLATNHKSLMLEFLKQDSVLPIHIIKDKMQIQKNHIYLNPPQKYVEFNGNCIKLMQKKGHKLSILIHTFFESLAKFKNEQIAGITLSGTDSDVSKGIEYIKDKGGLAPDSKRFDGMAKKSIQNEAIDQVCPVHEMPARLKAFFKNKKTHQIKTQDSAEQSARDVTKSIKNAYELMHLPLIAKQTTNSVLITDTQGRITFANEAFVKLTGYQADEVLGKIPGEFLQGEDTSLETIAEMRAALAEQKAFNVDIINYDKNNQKYWIHIHCEPMYDEEQKHIGFFSIQYDITRKKEDEERIETLTRLLQSRNQKLTDLNKSLEEFAYVASHDLKAPIQNIIGMVDLMKHDEDENYIQYMNMIQESANNMKQLIDSLLEYSRSGTLNESLAKVDLQELLQDVHHIYKSQLDEINARLDLNIEVEYVVVYPILFKRLFSNLISNAIKYRSQIPLEITINCYKVEDQIRFEVIDNGIGIDAKMHDTIFKIFKTVNPNPNSTGIGLSVCKKITELHHGQIWIESELEDGSRFYIEIPEL